MGNFKFAIGDKVKTIATGCPGIVLKQYYDTFNKKAFISYLIQCMDRPSVMIVDEGNLKLNEEYQPIKK